MAIITFSRELGSRGVEIASTLSSKLGYPKLDKRLLEILLSQMGMTEPEFERDDEKRPGFWDQLALQKTRYLDFLKAAMYRFTEENDCIIVGRGGNIIFRDVPGTLRLRIVAPHERRVARLRERFGVGEQQALSMIHQSDHERAGYHKYFFNAAWDSSADYDLVVNTACTSVAESCDMVCTLLRSSSFIEARDRAQKILRDLRIIQEVMIGIFHRRRDLVMSPEVVCESGTVILKGRVRSDAAIERSVAVARAVEGVTGVVSKLQIVTAEGRHVETSEVSRNGGYGFAPLSASYVRPPVRKLRVGAI